MNQENRTRKNGSKKDWQEDWREAQVCARLLKTGRARIAVQEMSDGSKRHYTRLNAEWTGKLWKRPKAASLGVITMPLRRNVLEPKDPAWHLTRCPACGAECWDRPLPAGIPEELFDGKLCTECALSGLRRKEEEETDEDE